MPGQPAVFKPNKWPISPKYAYPSSNNLNVGVFDIDWDNEMLISKQGELIHIKEYYHDLIDPEDYPIF